MKKIYIEELEKDFKTSQNLFLSSAASLGRIKSAQIHFLFETFSLFYCCYSGADTSKI